MTSRPPPNWVNEPWAKSGIAPSRLAELLALGEAENGRGRDPIDERLTRADRVAETEPCALGCCEALPVLRLVGVGYLFELRSIADLDGASFDHDIETVESVLASSENALPAWSSATGISAAMSVPFR